MTETYQPAIERFATSKPVRALMLVSSLALVAGCKVGDESAAASFSGHFTPANCDSLPPDTDLPPDVSALQELALAKLSSETNTAVCNAANWAAGVIVGMDNHPPANISFNNQAIEGYNGWQDNRRSSNGLNGYLVFNDKGSNPNLAQLQEVDVGTNGGYISIDRTETSLGTRWIVSSGGSFGNVDSSIQPEHDVPSTESFTIATQDAIYDFDRFEIYLAGLESTKLAAELIKVESQAVK